MARIFLLLLVSIGAGCQSKSAKTSRSSDSIDSLNSPAMDDIDPWTLDADITAKVAKPVPPFDLKAPGLPPAIFDGTDLSKLSRDELTTIASKAYDPEGGSADKALAAYAWAVSKGSSSFYRLAQCCVMKGMIDESLYWLQRCGLETDGVVELDRTLSKLRSDPRCEVVEKYLDECAVYWTTSGRSEFKLTKPIQFDREKKSPLIVCLPPDNSNPSDLNQPMIEEVANRAGWPVAVLSGTLPNGPRNYDWAGNRLDGVRVAKGVSEISDRIKVDTNRIVLLGFFRGGKVAIQIGARFPKTYAGSIAINPPGFQEPYINKKWPGISSFRVVIATGKLDNEAHERECANWLTRIGASVKSPRYDAPRMFHLPEDFAEHVHQWNQFLIGGP